MTDLAPYTPPPGCGLSDVACWRQMVIAGRQLGARPRSRVVGLRLVLKSAGRARLPIAHNSTGSVFVRLLNQLKGWAALDPALKPARAVDLRALSEAVASELGDAFDETEAARVLNTVRPRADLDN